MRPPPNPQTGALAGTGTVVKLVPTSLSFGNQPVGTKSPPKTVTLTNTGSVTLNISGITITGTDSGHHPEISSRKSRALAKDVVYHEWSALHLGDGIPKHQKGTKS
jgi:hypothetical protein